MGDVALALVVVVLMLHSLNFLLIIHFYVTLLRACVFKLLLCSLILIFKGEKGRN